MKFHTGPDAVRLVEQIIQGIQDYEDPTEVINRPLGEQQYDSLRDCAENMNGSELPMDAWSGFLAQYTVNLDKLEIGLME